jgi:formylglycine-generating enzyme
MTRARAIASISAVAATLAGCALFTDLRGFDCGADGCQDAGVDSLATTDVTPMPDARTVTDAGGADVDAGRCPEGRGPKMIVAGSFCIDSTEVTNEQYSAFVDDVSAFDAGPRPAICAFTTNRFPGCEYDPANKGNRPVRCIAWCQAWLFCKWAGKRLCGKIGGGSIVADQSSIDPTISEWMAACTRNGQRAYAYGTVLDSTKCPGDGLQPHDVGAIATCEGGYEGLFDMNGNVEEWEDACRPVDGGVICEKRGNDYASGNGACNQSFPEDVFEANGDTGFRCCAD